MLSVRAVACQWTSTVLLKDCLIGAFFLWFKWIDTHMPFWQKSWHSQDSVNYFLKTLRYLKADYWGLALFQLLILCNVVEHVMRLHKDEGGVGFSILSSSAYGAAARLSRALSILIVSLLSESNWLFITSDPGTMHQHYSTLMMWCVSGMSQEI